jgi:transcription antitermination factor NusG
MMPITEQDFPSLYPDDLLDNPLPVDLKGRIWWVLHVKPRQEKQLASQLHRTGVPFYLPLGVHHWRLRKRLMTSRVPLFPGYLFLWGDREERVAALATRRVVRSLDVKEQGRLAADLRQIQRMLATGAAVTREERLLPGTPVEIATGPLTGLQGEIVRATSGCRFIVRIDFIQQGASVQLDGESLMPLPHHELLRTARSPEPVV